MAGGGEDRTAVMLENFEPGGDVGSVFLAWLKSDFRGRHTGTRNPARRLALLRHSRHRPKKALKKRFASLDDFLTRWKSAERKQAIIEELENLPLRDQLQRRQSLLHRQFVPLHPGPQCIG
jgi:hypothetical protein